MSSNILLQKSQFLISDSHTEKKIPFLYKGEQDPSYVRVSTEEIPLSFANKSLSGSEIDLVPGHNRIAVSGGQDDWEHELNREDFTGNHLQVSGVAISEKLSEKSQDYPSDVEWSNLTMTKSGDNMVVSDYHDSQNISSMQRKILYPWRNSWNRVTIDQVSGTKDIELNMQTSITGVLEGVMTIEPEERNWSWPPVYTTITVTEDESSEEKQKVSYPGRIVPSYNYPYFIGVYDLQIEECSTYQGLYKILNTSSSGTDRKWIYSPYEEGKKWVICWDSTNYRWQLISYSSYDAETNTVTTYGSPLVYQYLYPFTSSWLYGSVDASSAEVEIEDKIITNYTAIFSFDNAGTNVLRKRGTDPFSNGGQWNMMNENEDPMGTAIDSSVGGDESEITIYGTRYRELSRNNSSYIGNWTNGVTVTQTGSNLEVSGFGDSDVNGEYDIFRNPTGTQNDIWIKYGTKSKYSISYDSTISCWKLSTTVDGIYEIVDGTETSVFRTWKDSSIENEGDPSEIVHFSNIICFNRYDNSFYVRNCKSLSCRFVKYGNVQGINFTIWDSTGNYYLRYSAPDYCWKLYDSSDNAISCQAIHPVSWNDFDSSTNYENTIIDWNDLTVTMDDAPFEGQYTEEDFDDSIHPFSMSLDYTGKSYYVTYDFTGARWKLIAKLNIDGTYKLASSSVQMKERVWEKVNSSNVVENSYKIVYNNDSSLSRWEIRDYVHTDNWYDYSVSEDILPEPFEAEYGGDGKIIEGAGTAIAISNFTGWSDATGSYSLQSGTGSSRIWTRTGTDGDYQVDWNIEDQKWHLKFINTKINDTYTHVSGSGSTSIWSLTIGTLTYTIKWIPSAFCWRLLKDNSQIISNSITTSFSTITSGWSNSAYVSFSGDNLLISGLSNSDANGEYSLTGSLMTSDLERTWSRIVNEISLFTVSYDMSELRWKIRYDDLDSNGKYLPYGSGTEGNERKWSHEGVNHDRDGNLIVYLIDWDSINSRWQIRHLINYLHTEDSMAVHEKRYFVYVSQAQSYAEIVEGTNWSSGDSESTGSVTIDGESYSVSDISIDDWFEIVDPLTWQTTSDSEPTGGEWSEGTSVTDPFVDSSVWNVGVSYVPPEDQQYNYTVSGNRNTGDEQARYNSIYSIQDKTAQGSNRVWKSSNDTYIVWVAADNAWAITSNKNLQSIGSQYRSDYVVCAYTNSDSSYANATDLSTLVWNINYYTFSGEFSIERKPVEEYGKNKQFWALSISIDSSGSETRYVTSNIVKFQMSVIQDDISNVSLNLIGSSGNSNYTGFFKTEDSDFILKGSYIPTDLITVNYSAYSSHTLRIKFSGVTIPGVDWDTEHISASVLTKTGILDETVLGDQDTLFNVTMYVMDEAGNHKEISKQITHIARLWRMQGTHVKEDSSGYSTKVYSVSSTGGLTTIPKTQISEEEYVRAWNDIFYPTTHGYPKLDDGSIDKENAIRISQETIDETGKIGPTSEELRLYDRLTLTTDKQDLSTDSDGRYITSEWNRTKTYSRMESSSYGTAGENLKYWIIDNSGYSDFQLEFEYFDLSSQVSSIPRNNLSPYEGDVLVIYDASAEGCLGAETDEFGRTYPVLADSSKLVELYAFTGSHYNEDISMKSDSTSTFDLQDFGFVTPKINSTSKLCLILYTDNDYQLSGFKIKAGPRHTATIHNYEILNSTGEIWVHKAPGTDSDVWYSPSRLATTHQSTTSNATIDYEKGIVTFDANVGSTITGDFTVYAYLSNELSLTPDASAPSGKWNLENSKPQSLYRYLLTDGTYAYGDIKSFLLYNDDCVDYYDIAMCVIPEGISTNYSDIYDYMNPVKNFGKITSGAVSNKDKGMIVFSADVPLGRLFASYNYHTYYRLTNDGYGDLYFYDNALIPSADYSLTGLKDWTYVDLMIYNEGSNALSEGLMKFMSRGYISGSGSSQTITQVVDENRPWDVQSGTIAETVNRTGASFNSSYTGLPAKTRAAAISTISGSSGGVSLGAILSARSKAYMRIYWCLAQQASEGSVTYVTTTRGKKLWSSEISGKYYVVTM